MNFRRESAKISEPRKRYERLPGSIHHPTFLEARQCLLKAYRQLSNRIQFREPARNAVILCALIIAAAIVAITPQEAAKATGRASAASDWEKTIAPAFVENALFAVSERFMAGSLDRLIQHGAAEPRTEKVIATSSLRVILAPTPEDMSPSMFLLQKRRWNENYSATNAFITPMRIGLTIARKISGYSATSAITQPSINGDRWRGLSGAATADLSLRNHIITGTKTSQVARIGNSVVPVMARVLVAANVPAVKRRAA